MNALQSPESRHLQLPNLPKTARTAILAVLLASATVALPTSAQAVEPTNPQTKALASQKFSPTLLLESKKYLTQNALPFIAGIEIIPKTFLTFGGEVSNKRNRIKMTTIGITFKF